MNTRLRLFGWSTKLLAAGLVCVLGQFVFGGKGCGENGAHAADVFNILWYVTVLPGALLWIYARFFLKDDEG